VKTRSFPGRVVLRPHCSMIDFIRSVQLGTQFIKGHLPEIQLWKLFPASLNEIQRLLKAVYRGCSLNAFSFDSVCTTPRCMLA
jgi:hypothetical protein